MEKQAIFINRQRESQKSKPYGTNARLIAQCNIFFSGSSNPTPTGKPKHGRLQLEDSKPSHLSRKST